MKEKSAMKARLLRALGIGVMFAFAFLLAFWSTATEPIGWYHTPWYCTEVLMVTFSVLYGWYSGTFARFHCNDAWLSICIILVLPFVLFYGFHYVPVSYLSYLAVGLCVAVLPWNIRGVLALCLTSLLAGEVHCQLEYWLCYPLLKSLSEPLNL
ncbi:MAG: hypothetical protein J6J31_00445 [Thermoguttaceae bacterium]|nr:hypothetical protein [Thermoguttaceae bacterium]